MGFEITLDEALMLFLQSVRDLRLSKSDAGTVPGVKPGRMESSIYCLEFRTSEEPHREVFSPVEWVARVGTTSGSDL